jgi:hypothetical protein
MWNLKLSENAEFRLAISLKEEVGRQGNVGVGLMKVVTSY